MVLRMACPTKRHGSDNWYFRRQIPADVRSILEKLPKAQRPRNWYRTHISISLKTANRAEAKGRCPEIAAEVEKQIAALRSGPKPLTTMQISALAGEMYRAFAENLEGNPVLSAKQWLEVAEVNEAARKGAFALPARMFFNRTEADQRRASMEKRFGPMVDAFLKGRGIFTVEESRRKLIDQFSVEASEAAKKLARNADGDYTPDTYVTKFPEFEERQKDGPQSKSLKGLIEAWYKAALDRDVRKRDATRIKRRFEMLIDFLGHDDANRVTKLDIIRWCDHRLANKIATKTIHDSDISSFKNVFTWGVDREWLAENPTEKVKLNRRKRAPVLRDEFFTPEEAKTILLGAASVRARHRENPKTTAAKRWVPWLCAYSGARVSEMIQIRKKDIREDATHGWVMRLTPEAGSIKNNRFCDVPVHEHLIATGFIDFVGSAKEGHLFCNFGKDGTIDGPAEGVYKRIYEMVREVVSDPAVQPNHGWRYTFNSYGMQADIQQLVLHAISNHSPRTKGEEYMKVTLKTRADAMAKFPRYCI